MESGADEEGLIPDVDVVIVGGGFAGLYMLYRIRALGLSVRLYEAGSGVGGTWFFNRYPGARCDVQSFEYSYSFSPELQQDWRWSERYAAQPEILRYLNHVADRFALWPDIILNTRIAAAEFNEATERWQLRSDHGDRIRAQFCVMAAGCLSAAKYPELPGISVFSGRTFHTGNWPSEPVDFTDERVGVIGTGSSGIQLIPLVARQARHLWVFQRTPNFSVPARNRPTAPEQEHEWKAHYGERRRQARLAHSGMLRDPDPRSALEVSPGERQTHYQRRWEYGGSGFVAAFADLLRDRRANETAADFFRGQIRALVRDAEVADQLSPRDHPLGTKRLCTDTEYYETYNRENVTLVDVRATPIVELTASGPRTAVAEYPLDSLVFATGYDAMTGALSRIDLRGRAGLTLTEKWSAGPTTYLGLAMSDFPNLFIVASVGSPSVLTNMVVSIEQHVEWIADCIEYLGQHGLAVIEADRDAEQEWVSHVNDVANKTLYPTANSWYLGANVPGKPRVFMPYAGGFPEYEQRCRAVAEAGYQGFRLSPPTRSR